MMKKRMAGRSPSGFNRNILLRRLESCKHKSSVEDIVEHLRSSFPDYKRIKQQPFFKHVQQTLEFQQRRKNFSALTSNASDEVEEDADSPAPSASPVRKKVKKMDIREQRLLRTEADYIRRKNRDQDRPSTSSAASSSSSSSGDDDESDGAVSTSEDAIYEEKVEPEFDLMKSMLRSSYSASKKETDTKVKAAEEKNLEMEVTNKEKKIGLIGGDGIGTLGSRKSADSKTSRERELSSGDGYEVKGKDGPRFKDLGGIKGVLDELMMEVIVPLYHPQLPRWLGVKPMSGILLHGPPGCGKTKLAHAIANETGVPFYKISATEVVSGVSGASEENIRDLFSKAYRTAPSIVFIDEIDAIASKRENLQREMERRIVTQLMTCMDESHQIMKPDDVGLNSEASDSRHGYVLVIGATNRPDAVDPALRRPGRFDREIVLSVPDENARIEIMSVLTRNLRLEGTFDLAKIARSTPGFVGADLAALANKAGNLAMKRIIDSRKSDLARESKDGDHLEEWWRRSWSPEEIEGLSITMVDFEEAAKMVQPSSRREGFSTIPNVKWEDIGGLDALWKEFNRYIVRRIKFPEEYEEIGVNLETGFLLYGPPGCGKTLIAKAVANEAGANFIHIKGPELLNKYVGESELAVRTIFSRARTCSPCILFFDEVDALTTTRGKEGGWVVERLLNQLLIELDGADQRRGVFVIGATNRPEVMDPAVLRPGRFGKLLYVPLPGPDERGLILKTLGRKKRIDSGVDLMAIGQKESCENLSGADLAAVMDEAAMAALEEKQVSGLGSSDANPWTIKATHIEQALEKISPSVSNKQKRYYDVLSQSFTMA
ncbi:cell division control protein 48 homolog C-like [Macadamia integrifolia]|uniref:cell division control protein 48 homolog C-like n=1 Tax=Macadamia integrifolia TaxID=60698 RepID=UPI001C4E6386|nr:cell division control protein 48 homolog C-like [Macadamia integrifolia]